MPSYLITGANRGLGFELVRQFSADSSNIVIGFVRDAASAKDKVAKELESRTNIHIIEAHLNKYESLKNAVPEVDSITGGKLDYLFANAALQGTSSGNLTFSTLAREPQRLEDDLLDHFKTNVIGNIDLINLYMPLILRGDVKKVVVLSSGMGDVDLINRLELDIAPSYAISKAALNVAVAKFSAEYRKQGILVFAISPGVVGTNDTDLSSLPEIEREGLLGMFTKFQAYAPHFQGPMTPEESATALLGVVGRATITNGYAGKMVSHFGNEQWI